MLKANFFRKSNTHTLKYRVIAIMLVVVLLAFSGCSPKDENSSVISGSSSEQSQSGSSSSSEASQTSSDSASVSDSSAASKTETDSSENKSEVAMTSSFFSESNASVAVDAGIEEGNIRTDALEVKRERYPANLAYGYKGYADKEADALREEILNTPNTLDLVDENGEKVYKIEGDIFYISPGGNNDNDGLSPETAIKTIDALGSLQLKKGDAVLFERDSLYRIYERFYLKEGVLYGSYGEGEKPLIVGSPKNYATVNWKPAQKRNVWVTEYQYNMPVGAFFNQGEEIGYLKMGLRDLTNNTYFYFDEEYAKLYLYCDKGNPADVYESIEFTQNQTDIWVPIGVDNITVDNIAIRYTTCGIGTNFMNTGITVTNCEIGFTGGGGSDPTRLRAGNGIGTWSGGAEMYVRHNWIYQTFDSAISPQGNSGKYYLYDNLEYTDNLLEFNNADIEWWSHAHTGDDGEVTWSRFVNFKMENNIMRFTSLGWGTRADDGGIRGIEGVWYGNTGENYLEGVTFKNNIIDCPGRQIFNFTVETQEQRDAMEFSGNTYYVKNSFRKDDVRMVYGWSKYVDGVVKSYYGTDAKSTKEAILLVDPTAKVYWYE